VIVFGSLESASPFRSDDGGLPRAGEEGPVPMARRTPFLIGVSFCWLGGALVATVVRLEPVRELLFGPETTETGAAE